MIGRTDIGLGTPLHEGVYVAEVYFGWKILEWRKGEWWHPNVVGRWTASVPVQWVGPLPALKGSETSKQVFDL